MPMHELSLLKLCSNSLQLPYPVRFDLPNGPKKVMAFGKFGTYKKVEILIEAVEEIRKSNNEPIEIVIAGTDSPNNTRLFAIGKEKYAHVPDLFLLVM